jgi:protein-L-isoaspartate(D-aspartate) O-methyltransferase
MDALGDQPNLHEAAALPAVLIPPLDPMEDELRGRLVAQLRASGALHDEAVEGALLRTPRHLFLPQVPLEQAYADIAVPTHWEKGVPVS